MKRLTISAKQGCKDIKWNTLALSLLVLLAFYKPYLAANELPPFHLEIAEVEQQLHSTSIHLDDAAQAVRAAKRYVEDKDLELAQAHQLQREQPSELNAHRLHHAQKRLVLARLGLDSRIARFERIQHQLESLALNKLNLMAEQAEALAQTDTEQTSPAISTLVAQEAPQPVASATSASSTAEAPKNAADSPSISQDTSTPNTTNASQTASLKVQNAKIFGAGIPGEITLEPAGASQFVGRFYAPPKNLSLFVGFRTDQYHSQEVPIKFAEHEHGQPFVFVLDLSDPERPLTRVFEESLIAEEELSSIYSAL